MNAETPYIKDAWRVLAGYPENIKEDFKMPSLETLKKSEWSQEYETLRLNRMVMGAFRYAPIKHQNLDKFDMIKETKKRITKYEIDGNLEHLIDAGNMLMIEFIKARRNGKKVIAIDDGEHNAEKM